MRHFAKCYLLFKLNFIYLLFLFKKKQNFKNILFFENNKIYIIFNKRYNTYIIIPQIIQGFSLIILPIQI